MTFQRSSKLKIDGFKMKLRMPQLKIGDKTAGIPIVQGGMGVGISLSGLASAVAEAGGIGVIAANAIGMLEPDYHQNGLEANKRALRKEIRKARKQTDGIIGVNIMVALNDFHELLQISIEEKIDMVFLGAGLPLKGIPVAQLQEAGVKVVPIVSSARAAQLIFKYWHKTYDTVPDAVVVEGPKAGGHLGFKEEQINDPQFALENLIPGVVKEIAVFEELTGKSIPVIAAGGVFYGEDIYKFFQLGAGGVQMATRFVATDECDADQKFKETYLACKEEDIMIIKSPVGMPGRAIRNQFLEEVQAGERKKYRCPWRCLDHCGARTAQYCISQALDSARHGDMLNGYAFAGANAYKVDRILSVKKLVKQLKLEYLKTVINDTVHLRQEFEDACKRLNAIKKEYSVIFNKSALSLKSDFTKQMEKGHASVQKEVAHILEKLESLKREYSHYFEKVNELKDQLSRYLDITPLQIQEPTFPK